MTTLVKIKPIVKCCYSKSIKSRCCCHSITFFVTKLMTQLFFLCFENASDPGFKNQLPGIPVMVTHPSKLLCSGTDSTLNVIQKRVLSLIVNRMIHCTCMLWSRASSPYISTNKIWPIPKILAPSYKKVDESDKTITLLPS